MNALGIPGVRISAEEKQTCGIRASHVRIVIDGEEEGLHHHHVHEHEHHHHHSGLAEIRSLIKGLELSEQVKKMLWQSLN